MPGARSKIVRGSLLLAAGVSIFFGTACSPPEDDGAAMRARTTLSQDLFGLVCNRLGASVLTEDLEGASYHALCFPDPSGGYADTVDTTFLPALPTPQSQALRVLAIAKLETLAGRRADLLRALDVTFDDVDVPVPFSAGWTIANHEALKQFLAAMVPLYGTNPADDPALTTEPLFPSVTRATGRLFAALSGPGDGILAPADGMKADAALLAMERIAGRQSYRPLRMILGALRPVLSYPELRSFIEALTLAVTPGAAQHGSFQNVLGAVADQLATSITVPPLAPLTVDAVRAQPNRPRTKLEFAEAAFLTEAPAFNSRGAAPKLVVKRDRRGVARPRTLTSFADDDGDGMADVDGTGRFVGPAGGLAAVDAPFPSPLFPIVNGFDAQGRAVDPTGTPVYEYRDLSSALLGELVDRLAPLLTSDATGQRGSVAELLRGAFPLWGQSVKRPAAWATGGSYDGFDTSASPMVDLTHAAGQLIGQPGSDVWLALAMKVFTEHPNEVARFMGAILKVRELSNARPDIALDPKVTIWDEMAEWLTAVAQNPVLFNGLVHALADPDLQAVLPPAVGKFATFRDRLTYNPQDINGAPLNLTTGLVEDPRTPVDRTLPTAGDNTSILQRSLAMIHDVNGVNACNRAGATMRVRIGATQLRWPLIGSYAECELFYFENMGLMYLDSILGQAQLVIRNQLLNGLVTSLNNLYSLDQIFEASSGVTGLTLSPTPQAMNRLVFFGAESQRFDPLFGGAMPDRDPYYNSTNGQTNLFVSNLVDAVSTSVCPVRSIADPLNPLFGQLVLADCAPSSGGTPQDVVRTRDPATIFAWETNDFYRGMRPFLKPFKDGNAGELFLRLSDILNRYWPGGEHGPECSKTGDFRSTAANYNPKYCAEAGVNTYEPLIAEIVATDLVPAMGALVQVLEPMTIVDVRRGGGTVSALDVLREMTLALFDPFVSTGFGVTDRGGNGSTTWADGVTLKAQTTPFDLFAKALQRNDDLLVGTDRFAGWRRARSTLVDTLFAVDGTGPAARFRNASVVPAVLTLLGALREQVSANCPDRETATTRCDWAVRGMAANAADTIADSDFGTVLHLMDGLLGDPATRSALEGLLAHLLQGADAETLQATTTSLGDLFQLLGDTETLAPIYRAISVASSPTGNANDAGAADRVVALLGAITSERDGAGNPAPSAFDPYRTVPHLLRNLVRPMDPADPQSFAPIEVFMDTFAEVNRWDASRPRTEPLAANDYRAVFGTLRDILTDRSRGLEQVYRIVNGRSDR